MSNNLIEDRAFVNSIVGEGTRFNGELDLNGLLRIDGDFTGTIKTTGKVLVGKNGRAECTINASTVVVGGAVKGNIYSSERVIVLSSGMILGNIYTPRLIVEEGVILDGECIIDVDYRKDSDYESGESAISASDHAAAVTEDTDGDAEKAGNHTAATVNGNADHASEESAGMQDDKQSVGNF
jgi:cytoskeletal protein CcmA (bactofilin family)